MISRQVLSAAIDIGIILLAAGTPLVLGGVHNITLQLACFIGIVIATLSLFYYRSEKRALSIPYFGYLLLGVTAFSFFQLVPLPLSLLKIIAPDSAAALYRSLVALGENNTPTWHH